MKSVDSQGRDADSDWWLVGLCAAWCGVCREFTPVFDSIQAKNTIWQSAWLDVEDADVSDALGKIDVETFPTVVLAKGSQLLFWGEVLPQANVLQRLVSQFYADSDLYALESLSNNGFSHDQQSAWQALRLLLQTNKPR